MPSDEPLARADARAPYPEEWESDVVLADGGTVHLRPVRRDDDQALLGLYQRLSDESIYLRFFSPVPRPTAHQLERLTAVDYDDRMALVAQLGGDVVAVARYDRVGSDTAEVAFTVQDDQQGRGLGTILLEHLAGIAREHGIRRFVAETLPNNRKMLSVFADAGFALERHFEEGAVQVAFSIVPTEESIAAVEHREHVSEARSMARLLAPRSVAVVGAGRRPGSIGHEIFRNLLAYEFNGPVYPVNPSSTHVAGVRAYPTLLDVPDDIDLAVVAVPASEVREVVEQCATKQVHGIVVISAGFAEAGGDGHERERALVELARRNGMRLVGPNCMGVVNTDPEVRLRATFAPTPPVAGTVAFLSQSGGLGIELMARAGRMGIGISSFVSVGNKADVSGNDLLQHWETDPNTDVILLYLESFGNPRKFARLARRVARNKPIVAVKGGRTRSGARGASSHTAAMASPDVAIDALFAQTGVIRVDTLEELLDTAKVLAQQPLPPGRRVAIVSNAGGPGILAADACEAAGLEVPELSAGSQAAIRRVAEAGASARNPVDLVAAATAEQFEAVLRIVLADEGIDAVLVVFVPPQVTEPSEVAAAVRRAAGAAGDLPVVAAFLGHDDTLAGESEGGRKIPTFAFPESAAFALGHAADLAEWRARPEGVVPDLPDIDVDAARALCEERMAAAAEAGAEDVWLTGDDAAALCRAFGIRVAPTRLAATAEEAVAAAGALGYPVVLKTANPAFVHKTDVGGVALDLADETAVRAAFAAMQAGLGDDLGGVVVQSMLPAGIETIVGVTQDRSFGSLVLFGLGGTTAELLGDHTQRVLPITDVDAREVVRSLRGSALLFGYRGAPPVDVAALEDLVVRVGRLADELPEVAEMDANPVLASAAGVCAVDVKVRLARPPLLGPVGVRRMRAGASFEGA